MEKYLLIALIALPTFWILIYGAGLLIFRKVPEGAAIQGTYVTAAGSLLIDLMLGWALFKAGSAGLELHLGDWFRIAQYEFSVDFIALPETIFLQAFSSLMVLTIAKFSSTYLHRESGVHRFYFLINIFQVGHALILFSNSIDILFMGWELVGITSVLLISFYNQRESTVKNALWALTSYRLCDVGILLAAGLTHLMLNSSNIQVLINSLSADATGAGVVVACLLIYGSLAKAGQFPFFSWVMRAMEGPTPSSALYYGALSIALGPVLLIKFHPLIMAHPEARVFLFAIGAVTAPFALMASQARADVKSILAHSAILQMAFAFMELALGLKWIAVLHITANGLTRLYQFLRSMDSLKDFYENPLFFRGSIIESASPMLKLVPPSMRTKLYYMALHGTGPDVLMVRWVVAPWMRMLAWVDKFENGIVRSDPMTKNEAAEAQGPAPEWRAEK